MPVDVITDNTTPQRGAFDTHYTGTEDVSIRQENPPANYDSDPTLSAGNLTGEQNTMLLRPIGVSNIPANSTINSAILHMLSGGGLGNINVATHRCLRGWVRNQASFNNFSTGNPWGTAGASGAADIVSPASASVAVTEGSVWYTWDITPIIQAIVNGAANNGLAMLSIPLQDNAGFRTFVRFNGTDGTRWEIYIDHQPGVSASITSGVVRVGTQLQVTTVGGLTTITTATLGGQPLIIDSSAANIHTLTIPADVDLLWGVAGLTLSVSNASENTEITNLTLLPRTGWEAVILAAVPDFATTDSLAELATNDVAGYDAAIGDQFQMQSVVDVVLEADSNVDAAEYFSSVYAFFDASAATRSAEFNFTLTDLQPDTTPPVITLLRGSSILHSVGAAFDDPGYTAIDNVDGDISANVLISGDAVNVNTAGTYLINYDVSDAAGNPAVQVQRTVEVINPSLPYELTDTLQASDASNNASFGSILSLSLNGDVAVVGTLNADAVYVFTRSGTAWTEQQRLVGSDTVAGDQFGRNVSISPDGRYIVVGAALHSSGQGAAYVFFESSGVWSQQAKLTRPTPVANDYFGGEVDIDGSGSRIVVGVNNNSSLARNVYVFLRTGVAWAFEQTISPTDTELGDGFSDSAIINDAGDMLIVGASAKNSLDGRVYIFNRSGATWSQSGFIDPTVSGDLFGRTASISQDGLILAIASGNGTTTGAISMFSFESSNWVLDQTILPPADQSPNFIFGRTIALSLDGSTLAIGASGDDTAADNAGAVHVYIQNSENVWVPDQFITPQPGEIGEFFAAVTLDSSRNLLIGSRFGDIAGTDEGRVAYLYRPDLIAPVISLIESDVTIVVGGSYTEPGYAASDNIDGDITASVIVGGDVVDPATVGTYVVTYDVVDNAGNAAIQQQRQVHVIPELQRVESPLGNRVAHVVTGDDVRFAHSIDVDGVAVAIASSAVVHSMLVTADHVPLTNAVQQLENQPGSDWPSGVVSVYIPEEETVDITDYGVHMIETQVNQSGFKQTYFGVVEIVKGNIA